MHVLRSRQAARVRGKNNITKKNSTFQPTYITRNEVAGRTMLQGKRRNHCISYGPLNATIKARIHYSTYSHCSNGPSTVCLRFWLQDDRLFWSRTKHGIIFYQGQGEGWVHTLLNKSFHRRFGEQRCREKGSSFATLRPAKQINHSVNFFSGSMRFVGNRSFGGIRKTQ